jgi:hypothetical protein
MGNADNFPDGRKMLIGSPFRSMSFLIDSVLCFSAILAAAYILSRHWHTLNSAMVLVIAVFIGLQLFYQWLRALRYFERLRELYLAAESEPGREGSNLDIALRAAAFGMTDLLFYHFAMVLLCLVLIGSLLFRIDGIK